ncbi:membrane protein [Beggiatoa sp. SS]|nr:membrane protein [Beggiatoa sp. SS]
MGFFFELENLGSVLARGSLAGFCLLLAFIGFSSGYPSFLRVLGIDFYLEFALLGWGTLLFPVFG